MPTFDTPDPITVNLDLGVADVRIVAGNRADTVVDVRPSDPSKKGDVVAAEQTRVELAAGRLQIRMPKGWRQYTWWAGDESIDLEIALPAGSTLLGEAGVAALRGAGRFEACRYKTGVGALEIEEAGEVQLRTGAGDVTVERVTARAEVATASGAVQLGSVDGPAVVKNSNGDTWIGDVTGDLRANAANGKITVDRARASVVAKSANGDLRIRGVAGSAVVAETGLGNVEVSVAPGVAAYLDLRTRFGTVENQLDAAAQPEPAEAAVEIRARTSHGDISVRRAGDERTHA